MVVVASALGGRLRCDQQTEVFLSAVLDDLARDGGGIGATTGPTHDTSAPDIDQLRRRRRDAEARARLDAENAWRKPIGAYTEGRGSGTVPPHATTSIGTITAAKDDTSVDALRARRTSAEQRAQRETENAWRKPIAIGAHAPDK